MAHSMRLVEERRIAHFLQRRNSSASAPSSILSSMPSSVTHEEPESLPPTTTPVATSNSFPASSLALAIALSILGLIILGVAFWRLRAWRRKSTQGAASVFVEGDLEQQQDKWLAPSKAVPLSLDTVAAPPGVAWVPQFRSISGPEVVKEGVKSPSPKRSRSPPPPLVSQDPFADPRPKSAPLKSPGTLDVECAIGLSSPSSPQPYAFSVSGYQVRGVRTKEKGKRDLEV